MKSWLRDNNIEMYPIYNEGTSLVTERFIRTLKNENHKLMTSIPKNMNINKLDDIVNKYNNAYHRAIKMKPVDINPSMYIYCNKENNKGGLYLKWVIISKYQNIKIFLQNAMLQIGLKKFF